MRGVAMRGRGALGSQVSCLLAAAAVATAVLGGPVQARGIVAQTAGSAATATGSGDVAPGAVWDPIPYGAKRVSQMANYARIHYGSDSATLTDVRQIVLHYTVTSTYPSVHAQFASNAKARTPTGAYVSPGTCTHFVIDRDGTTYQLVSLDLMCRHAVGLNHRSIGIEFVEPKSADSILRRPRQMAAGLKLVRWLQARYGIADSDVIGHGMVNKSRWFQERVKGWRNTHTDWNPRQVAIFRGQL
jgi:hypothetical protein